MSLPYAPRAIALVLLIVISVGIRIAIRSAARGAASSNSSSGPIIRDDDPSMRAAVTRAQNNVLHFEQHIARPGPGEKDFAVRMAVRENDEVEYFWLANTTWDGNVFRGEIDDEPDTVTTVHIWQKMLCAPTDISDWMYVKDGRLVGGETIRVVRDRMTEDQRRRFDSRVPFRFD